MFTKRENEESVLFLIRWTARVLSLAAIFLLMLFMLGEGFFPADIRGAEWLGLLFFPFGLVVGLAVAWHREMLGGLTALLSIAGFYLVYGILISGNVPRGWVFFSFGVPAILFVLYGVLDRLWFSSGRHQRPHTAI